jgi:hypothetical protein
MEDCRRVFTMLSEYLDHELPDDLCDEIATHIERCPPCVEFVTTLRRTIGLCRNYGDLDLQGPLAQDAKRRLLEAYRKVITAA